MPKLQPTGRGVSQTKCGQAAARRVERMACAILRDKRDAGKVSVNSL